MGGYSTHYVFLGVDSYARKTALYARHDERRPRMYNVTVCHRCVRGVGSGAWRVRGGDDRRARDESVLTHKEPKFPT